jgi:hypothetical protein
MTESFTITGQTTSFIWVLLPSDLARGHFSFRLTAEGTCTGFFKGTFSFSEWVSANPLTLRGSNHGHILITTSEGSTVSLAFAGDATANAVGGNFSVLSGTGDHFGLRGGGTYSGNAALEFTVDFGGRFIF